jgi:beta-mannosidase
MALQRISHLRTTNARPRFRRLAPNLADWLQTSVPSSIFTSLIQAEQIDPTDLNTNPEKFEWVSQKPWIYKKNVKPPKNFSKADRIDLIFEGLDTVTQIWLNEKLIAKTQNMFIPYRFDVTEHLKPKNNTLLIKFTPALEYAQRLEHRYGPLAQFHADYPSRPYIRKAQYQFLTPPARLRNLPTRKTRTSQHRQN